VAILRIRVVPRGGVDAEQVRPAGRSAGADTEKVRSRLQILRPSRAIHGGLGPWPTGSSTG
jgi:hypothetical protein